MLAVTFFKENAQLEQAQFRYAVVCSSSTPITRTLQRQRIDVLIRTTSHRLAELSNVHIVQFVAFQTQRLQLPELEWVLRGVGEERLERLAIRAVVCM